MKILLSLFILSLALMTLVSAESVCFPIGSELCDYVNPSFPCVCKDAIYQNGYWYCDIEKVVSCPNGCVNGECVGGNPNCSNGWQKCGNTNTYDPDGDVYECNGGNWALKQECTNGCTETGVYASCDSIWYYCQKEDGTCYKSDKKMSNCFNTLEECQGENPPINTKTILIIASVLLIGFGGYKLIKK